MKKEKDTTVLLVNPWCVQYAELIKELFPKLKLIAASSEAEIKEDVRGVDIVVSWDALEKTLPKIKDLKWFQALSAGVEQIVRSGSLPESVPLTNAAGVAAIPIAEYVISYLLFFVKKHRQLSEIRSKKEIGPPIICDELYGKTIGIMGVGHIGKAVAKRAKAFEMVVIGYDSLVLKDENADRIFGIGELNEFLSLCDFVVITLSLNPNTTGLIGKRELNKMKPSAYIVNVARAEIIDERGLKEALRERWIAGCAIDVFWSKDRDGYAHYLDKEDELWDLENVIISPHCTALTDKYTLRSGRLFCENLRGYFSGESFVNLVDRKAML